MLALLDTSEALDVCAMELGHPVKQLLTPLTGFIRQKEHDEFAIDNGCFKRFERQRFFGLLNRENEHRHLCKFVTVPDVVGEALRTMELFEHFHHKMTGWPLALVAQNGLENMRIPWDSIQAIFIGGTDKNDGNGDWKMSNAARGIVRTAQTLGRWVHVGRVNGPERFYQCLNDWQVDSVDGTGISRYSHMREKIKNYNPTSLQIDLALGVDESSAPELSRSPIAEIATAITTETGTSANVLPDDQWEALPDTMTPSTSGIA